MTDHEKRIREALEDGPTDGNWITDLSNPNLVAVDSTPYEYICEVAPSEFSDSDHEYEQEVIDATYIAACNPSAIRALLADLDAMRGALERIAAWHEGDEVTPSFDEPHAAAIARNALTGVSDADGAQDAPIPCDVFAGGSLFKKGAPFAELAEHMETEAARLVWAMAHMGMSNDYSRNFTTHVLRVGGIGDIHDCRSFIDAALKGAAHE